MTLEVIQGASAPEPDALSVFVRRAGDLAILVDQQFPDSGPLDLPGSIVLRFDPQELALDVRVEGTSGGVPTSVATGLVTVRPYRDTGLELVLEADGGTDGGINDVAVPDAMGTDSGSDSTIPLDGAVPPSSWCVAGSEVVIVTIADDELDSPAAVSIGDVGGPGDVSLREAMVIAENNGVPTAIRFDPGVFAAGSSPTISIGTGTAGPVPLPALAAGNTCIDGAGALVLISGAALPASLEPGIRITSQDNILANVFIGEFPADGIHVAGVGAVDNRITGCGIGVVGSTTDFGNGDEGIEVRDGALRTKVGPGNVIGFNAEGGVEVENGAADTQIIANHIGLFGPSNIGNGTFGVRLAGAGPNTGIGGPMLSDRNFIGFNVGGGIYVDATSATFTIRHNSIGATSMMTPAANGANGIQVLSTAGGIIGPENVIAFNISDGIDLGGMATLVTITGNLIFMNTGSGIDMDPGSNGGIQPPAITSASPGTVMGSALVPDGSIVELFSDGADEGECIVELDLPVTGGTWSTSMPTTPCGSNITATVTDLMGNTSRFSMPVPTP